MTEPSKHDVCAACHHPRHRHQDAVGICTEHDTVTKMPDGVTITSTGQPCHCNLFRLRPYTPRSFHPDDEFETQHMVTFVPIASSPSSASMGDAMDNGDTIQIGDESEVHETRGMCEASLRWPHLPPEFLDAMNAGFEAGIKDGRVAIWTGRTWESVRWRRRLRI